MNANKIAAVGLHTVATVLLFVLTAIGWHLMPNGIWGLYTLTDGALAAWNSRSILAWSEPFDASPQNFMQGLMSLYIPNTPWLNPGALALSLPVETHLQYYLSYAIYLIEILASVVVLGRALGFSWLRSILAGQLLCLVIFPPYTSFFFSLPWISLAPFNAHLMASCNVLLALVSVLGRMSTGRNAAAAIGILALLASLFYSAAVTPVTYVPVYALFAFAVTTYRPTRRSLFWATGLAAVVAALTWALGMPEFYAGTSQVTSSHMLNGTVATADFAGKLAAMHRAWNAIDWCNYPQTFFICSSYHIRSVHAAGLAGAVILAIFYRGLPRRLGLCMFAYVLLLHVYAVAAEAAVLGILNRINKDYLLFASYTFYALFSVAAVFSIVDGMKWLWRRRAIQDGWQLFWRATATRPVILGAILRRLVLLWPAVYTGLALTGAVAAGAILWDLAQAPLTRALKTKQVPPPAVGVPHKTGITDLLAGQTALRPGEPFRGSVATYFGAPTGPLRERIGFGGEPNSSTSLYHNSRFYMDVWYGNTFMMTDLWRYNIPTFEEYGQWVTKSLYVFARETLSFAKPQDDLSSWEINIYKLNLSLMRALGVRFIVTDSELVDERLTLRAVETARHPVRPEVAGLARAGSQALLEVKPVPVRLYEVRNPNLGTYSPVKVTAAATAKATLDSLLNPGFSPETEVVLQEAAGIGALVPAAGARMEIEKGRLRVVASSGGASLLLLPVQFSHCLTVQSRPGQSLAKPRLLRANLVESALLFEREVDASISFDFGPGRTQCRMADVKDFERLDFSPWGR